MTNDESYQNTANSASTSKPQTKRGRKQLCSPSLASALDRTKVSDRNATILLASTAVSLGENIENYVINRSSIRRFRIKHRQEVMNEILLKFNPDVPLVVHWDGKILPELTGKTSVDRLPILVTGEGITQLLGVPKLSSGTGEATAAAVYNLLEHWNVTNKVKAMCFDTTASNSGQKNGACVLLEGKNKQNLLHLACRHHIYELVLESAFSVTIKYSASPDIQLFKRFQTK